MAELMELTGEDAEAEYAAHKAAPPAEEVTLTNNDGTCSVRFRASGWDVLTSGDHNVDYLHLGPDAPYAVTDAVRDQLLRYWLHHPAELPGLGATPQRYFRGLTDADRERII